jgi:peptidoglycan/LPS O-acetylase OafA/YrhL
MHLPLMRMKKPPGGGWIWCCGHAPKMFFRGRVCFSFTDRASAMPAFLLVVCFLVGVSMHQWKEGIIYDRRLFVLCAVLSGFFLENPVYGDFLAILPVCYCTIFLGLTNFRKTPLLLLADYSYGIFLYGYAIQQGWMSLGPTVHHWWLNLLLALPTTIAFSALSWHLVEEPASRLRFPLLAIEAAILVVRDRLFATSLNAPHREKKQAQ